MLSEASLAEESDLFMSGYGERLLVGVDLQVAAIALTRDRSALGTFSYPWISANCLFRSVGGRVTGRGVSHFLTLLRLSSLEEVPLVI